MKKIINIFASIIFLTSVSYSQIEQEADTVSSDIYRFYEVGRDIFTHPLHLDSKDWTYIGGTVIATGIGYLLDNNSRETAKKNINVFNDSFFSVDKYYYYQGIGISILGIYGYGLLADNQNMRKLSLQLVESTVYASIVTLALKSIIGRNRPYTNKGKSSFEPFNFSPSGSAFPSGHTTLAFSYAAVISAQIDNLFWKAGWYTAASAVGIARIYHDSHWLSDVILGAAIGYFIGQFVNNHPSNGTGKDSGVSLYLDFKGMGIQYTF